MLYARINYKLVYKKKKKTKPFFQQRFTIDYQIKWLGIGFENRFFEVVQVLKYYKTEVLISFQKTDFSSWM